MITIILPVIGEMPALTMAAIKIDMTEVVVQVEDACKRVYASGKMSAPSVPIKLKITPRRRKL